MELGFDEKQITAIQRLGLTEYESRAYLGLVKLGPSKAGELSFFAQIPRTKTYGALKELTHKGLVRIIPGKPELYLAVSPNEALLPALSALHDRLKDSEEIVLELNLVHEASRFVKRDVPKESAEFWEINGRQALFSKVNQILLDAKKSVCYATTASGLIRAYKAQAEILEKASRRGVSVRLLAPTSSDNVLVAEQLAEISYVKRLDQSFTSNFVSVDSEQLVVVDSKPDDLSLDSGTDLGIWTTNKLLVGLHEQFFDRLWNSLPAIAIPA